MWRRRFWFITVLILAMASTSCTTTNRAVRRVYLPSNNEVTLTQLASALSQELKMPLSEEADDLGLYVFVADWIGTPYRFGRNSKKGTDCSGFAYLLYLDVYKKNIGRASSSSLMQKSRRIKRSELKEGDLVFFNINNRRGGRASHVGVYLKDDKFAHASTQQGVIVSSLNDPYYRRTYIGAGRMSQ